MHYKIFYFWSLYLSDCKYFFNASIHSVLCVQKCLYFTFIFWKILLRCDILDWQLCQHFGMKCENPPTPLLSFVILFFNSRNCAWLFFFFLWTPTLETCSKFVSILLISSFISLKLLIAAFFKNPWPLPSIYRPPAGELLLLVRVIACVIHSFSLLGKKIFFIKSQTFRLKMVTASRERSPESLRCGWGRGCADPWLAGSVPAPFRCCGLLAPHPPQQSGVPSPGRTVLVLVFWTLRTAKPWASRNLLPSLSPWCCLRI